MRIPRIRRIKRQELLKFIDRQHVRFGRAFSEICVTDGELRIGTKRALRVRFRELPEKLAGGEPMFLAELFVPSVEEKLIRTQRAGRHGATAAGGARRCRGKRQTRGKQTTRPDNARRVHNISVSHLCSAASPSSRPTAGANPRSARARDVSA